MDENNIATPDQHLVARCPNCGAKIEGPYCSQCGQNQRSVNRFFLSLVNEAFDDVFSLDSRSAKTLGNLIFRPGYLTTEYFKGRRARYIQPLRLYLITSVVFFFYLSISNTFRPNVVQLEETQLSTEEQQVIHENVQKGLDREALKEKAKENLSFELPWLSDAKNRKLDTFLGDQLAKAIDDPSALGDALLDLAPPVMFVIMPLFAGLLKLVYTGSHRYYVEHLVLAVHNQSFVFVALLLLELLELPQKTFLGPLTETLTIIVILWMPVYMYISLRRTYGEAHWLTAVKYIVLFTGHHLLVLSGLVLALLWGLMTL